VADKLSQSYNVEVGDCLYCRIPKAKSVGSHVEDFHMLVDCGSLAAATNLKAAVANLETLLPDIGGGKRHLDLLVVTHEHKDHIAGFDPQVFQNIAIDQIYEPAMDPPICSGPHAEAAAKPERSMRNLAAKSRSQPIGGLVALYGVGNARRWMRKWCRPRQHRADGVHAG
jgi:glyoxylase-like metal-dependent hydrolase (beta-lactamase superfamily II)